MILGDVNCDLDCVQPLFQRLASGDLIDAAAIQEWTGEPEPLTTCMGHTAGRQERRDFILINRFLVQHVRRVFVIPDAGYDVHLPLCIQLGIAAPPKIRTWAPPTRLCHP